MSNTNFTITEAARLYNKQRSTLYAHIKKGQLSCTLHNDGRKRITLSELIRAYGEPPEGTTDTTRSEHNTNERETTPKNTDNNTKNQQQIGTLLNELRESQERERQAWAAVRERDQALIEEQRKRLELQERLLPSPEHSSGKRPWWKFWRQRS